MTLVKMKMPRLRMPDQNKLFKAGASGILFLAILLRIPVFLNPHFGFESILVFYLKNTSILNMIKSAIAFDLSPLFYIVLPLWCKIDFSEHWIVILPLTFNIASVWLICKYTSRWGGVQAGIIAGFLAAVSPYMIHCSSSPRYENFIIFFVVINIFNSFALLNGDTSRKTLLVYIASSLLAMYTYYYFLYILLFQNFYFLLLRRSKLRIWLQAQICIALLFLPWVPIMLRIGSSHGIKSKGVLQALDNIFLHTHFLNIIDIITSFFAGMHFPLHEDTFTGRFVLTSGLLLIIVGIRPALFRTVHENIRTNAARYLLAMMAICMFTALVGNEWLGLLLHPRHAVIFFAGWIILFGLGISSIRTLPIKIAFIAFVSSAAAVSLFSYYPQMNAPNEFRDSLDRLRRNEMKDDVILVAPPYYLSAVQYYYRGNLQVLGLPKDHDLILNDFGQNGGEPAAIMRVREFSNRNRIWFILPRDLSEPRIAAKTAFSELHKLGYRDDLVINFISDVIPRYDGKIILLTKNLKSKKSK